MFFEVIKSLSTTVSGLIFALELGIIIIESLLYFLITEIILLLYSFIPSHSLFGSFAISYNIFGISLYFFDISSKYFSARSKFKLTSPIVP